MGKLSKWVENIAIDSSNSQATKPRVSFVSTHETVSGKHQLTSFKAKSMFGQWARNSVRDSSHSQAAESRVSLIRDFE